MSVIREVYSANDGAKEQYSVTRPETVIEMADRVMDAICGPTAYSGVAKLNRAAEYCADRAMIAATEIGGAQECENYAQACLILQTLADSLDAYLVESFLEADHA